MNKLHKQISFLLEIDKLKTILRRNVIADGTRVENDAEHSWYFAMAAFVLAEYAGTAVNIDRVIRMGLIHDIVEIDAGDTFVYDEAAKADQKEREERAMQRLFGLLPENQANEYIDLWREFEENQTPESQFARAIDRLVPLILNYASEGKAWKLHGITAEKILQVNERIAIGSPALWDYAKGLIDDAKRKGFTAG